MMSAENDVKPQPTCSNESEMNSDEEYEEEIMVLELHGVLDGESIRQAVRSGQLVIRKAETDHPLVQIGSSVYTGKWNQTVGTDLIFHSSNRIVHNPAVNDFEMNDMFHPSALAATQLDLIAASSTRLISHKALITSQANSSINTRNDKGTQEKAAEASSKKGRTTAKRSKSTAGAAT